MAKEDEEQEQLPLRMQQMAAISDSLDESRSGEFDAPLSDEEKEASEIIPETAEETPEEITEETPEEPTEEPVLHTLVINGREEKLTTEQLIARAQKVGAADDYLRESARLFKEAQALPKGEPSLDEDDKALARALQTGTEEEAAAVIHRLRSPSITKDDLARHVDERLAASTAFNRFQLEYPKLVSDPDLYELATAKDAKLVQNGDSRSYWERYQSIGDELYAKFGFRKAEESTNAEGAETRQQRKAKVTPLPVANVRAKPRVEDEGEENPSDVIAQMAKARGQSLTG